MCILIKLIVDGDILIYMRYIELGHMPVMTGHEMLALALVLALKVLA